VSVINFVAQRTIEHRMLSVLVFKSALAQGILDNGDDAIFMDTDTFTKFMETVEAVTVDMQDEAIVSAEEVHEPAEMGLLPATFNDTEANTEEIPETKGSFPEHDKGKEDEDEDEDEDADVEEEDVHIEGDDDIVAVETITQHHDLTPSPAASSTPEPQDLLVGGLRFLSGLAQTLSSPEATQRLASSLVERDEKTGRSYMKIPVDDQQTVVNVMNMLGQLFKGFGK